MVYMWAIKHRNKRVFDSGWSPFPSLFEVILCLVSSSYVTIGHTGNNSQHEVGA